MFNLVKDNDTSNSFQIFLQYFITVEVAFDENRELHRQICAYAAKQPHQSETICDCLIAIIEHSISREYVDEAVDLF